MKQIDFKDLYEQACTQLDVANAEISELQADIGRWASGYSSLMRDYHELKKAATKTVFENGHLADGENCTLRELVVALENARDE
jgi:hypothetical protein